MSELVRFTASIEEPLLKAFDDYCAQGKFATRSEALRQLFREKLTHTASEESNSIVAASLTLVFDHHRRGLQEKMTQLQHDHENYVIATTHVHLNHDLCMEVLMLRGSSKSLRAFAASLSGLKGIHQAQLVVIHAGEQGHSHGHGHSHSH
ncbi:nickel-responsive transcriptional regulator NikR [Telmatocola sphagniphila]|uniref:Putative nickel-responsive regulator n=1 Tax=Telmatocola sphagniphila TaxID=1123043 RepID=A0A8E6B5W7_9BACT|nr:nickel-responsive transcriptional regulator NikR [Telmatocola sphagniphila]QVL30980.1 nickel-responsive transcriptional regulator NikR [Telmatocola sphagniphila]